MTKEQLEELEMLFRRTIDNQFYLDSPMKVFLREVLEQIQEELKQI